MARKLSEQELLDLETEYWQAIRDKDADAAILSAISRALSLARKASGGLRERDAQESDQDNTVHVA
jgi:hypothetical protein